MCGGGGVAIGNPFGGRPLWDSRGGGSWNPHGISDLEKVLNAGTYEAKNDDEDWNDPAQPGSAKTVYDPETNDSYSPEEYTELLRNRRNAEVKAEQEAYQEQLTQKQLALNTRKSIVLDMRNNNPLRSGQSLIQTTAPATASESDKYKDLPEAIKDEPPVKSPEQNLDALGSALGVMSNKEKLQDLMGADGMRELATKSNLQNSTDPQDKIMLERWQAWQRKKRGTGAIPPGMSIFSAGRRPVMGLMGEIPAEYLL
ncbi:hypothetical protein NO1_0280 [Candidatus Termititenax aidoneus]|uniref:Uncharacterized protein n=1 Tax=Termititenax aidoneus TaxID=2218524 RepID=A0A388T9P9_TERA1|nr:hypothetical protein NO1_0280 [Candidatus Termititenax aidoneus]